MTAVPTSTDAVQDLVVEYLRKYHRAEDAHKRARKNLAPMVLNAYSMATLAIPITQLPARRGRATRPPVHRGSVI